MRAYNGAIEAEGKRDVARAEALYREAVQRDAGFCDAMDNLGLLLRRQGKVDEAIEWYRKSLALQPRSRVARVNLGVALRRQGKLDESLREYTTVLEQEPDDAEAHYGAGLTYLEKENWRAALEHFDRAEKLYWVQRLDRPELMADATMLKGITQWNLRDCPAATKSLESIEKARSEDGDLNYVLGMCSLDGHRNDLAKGVPDGTPWFDRARTYLRRAQSAGKKLDPEVARALRL